MIRAEMSAEEKRKANMQRIGNAISSSLEGTARAALMAAVVQKGSAREAVKGFATAGALEMTLTGTMELIRAAVAAASFNYPKATQHGINAGLAFGQAAILGGIAGVASIGGGGRKVAGFGGSDFGGGGFGGGGGSSGGSEWRQPKPISRSGGGSGWGAPAGGGKSSGGNVYNVTIHSQSLGKPDEAQMVHTLRKALKQNERDMGKV